MTYSDVGHGSQVIDLMGSNLGDDMKQVGRIAQISIMQEEPNTRLVKSKVMVVSLTYCLDKNSIYQE